MQYNFKVELTDDLYKLFLNEEDEIEEGYLEELKNKYGEFRIKYNDSPENHRVLDMFDMLEGFSDHYQILLVAINDNTEYILCYYFLGDDEEDTDYKLGVKAFKEMLKYKID